MIITKAKIRSFAGIKNKEIEFQKGFNLVYGENEKGKSSIQAFIKLWLFGMPQRGGLRKKYTSFTGESMEGELYLENRGESYLIKRVFGKTKKDDFIEIINLKTRKTFKSFNGKEPGNYFLEISEKTFDNTLYIPQLGVEIKGGKEDELLDRVQEVFSGSRGESSAPKAIERLEGIRKELSNNRQGGIIDKLYKKINILEEEHFKALKIIEKNLENSHKILEERKKKKYLEEEGRDLELYRKVLKREKVNLIKDEIEKNNLTLEQEKTEASEYEFFNSLDSGLKERLIKLNIEQENIQAKIIERERILESIEEERKKIQEEGILKEYLAEVLELKREYKIEKGKIKKDRNKNLISIEIILILGMIISFVLLKNILTAIVLLIGAVVCGYLISREIPVDKESVKNIKFIEERFNKFLKITNLKSYEELFLEAERLEKLEEVNRKSRLVIEERLNIIKRMNSEGDEERYSQNKRMIESLLKMSNSKDMEELYSKLDNFLKIKGIEEERVKKGEFLNTLISGTKVEEIEEGLMHLKEKYDYTSEEEVNDRIKNISRDILDRERLIKDLENSINLNLAGERDINLIFEELQEAKEKRDFFLKKLKATEIAIEVLRKNDIRIKGKFGPTLNKNIGDNFKKLTNNKYTDVILKEDYKMMVDNNERIFGSEFLSNGSKDQLYLALRLGFIELIFKDREVIVLLDEIFLQYDDLRREQGIKLLIEKNYGQVILFTCQKAEENIIKNNQLKGKIIYL